MEWQPFLLRPDAPEEGWALPEAIKARARQPGNPLKVRAAALGLTMVERDWVPNSRRAHECTEFARAQGRLEPFHAGVLERYWSRGEDLHDWAVLEAAAKDAGLDATQMRAQVETGRYRQAVADSISQAHELGVTGVPTFVVEGRYALVGAQPADAFREVFSRLGVVAH